MIYLKIKAVNIKIIFKNIIGKIPCFLFLQGIGIGSFFYYLAFILFKHSAVAIT